MIRTIYTSTTPDSYNLCLKVLAAVYSYYTTFRVVRVGAGGYQDPTTVNKIFTDLTRELRAEFKGEQEGYDSAERLVDIAGTFNIESEIEKLFTELDIFCIRANIPIEAREMEIRLIEDVPLTDLQKIHLHRFFGIPLTNFTLIY